MAFLISAIADNINDPGGLWEILILGLFDFIVNYGWRIVFFTVCLKILLLPLDLYQRFKMRKNQIITERLKPQIEKLQQQYAGDQRTLQQKQMELNRKEGFSYFSSCLPMIVTLVIFFYLFAGLNNISHYRIFKQYVELYDAYVAEETIQKDVTHDLGATDEDGKQIISLDLDDVVVKFNAAGLTEFAAQIENKKTDKTVTWNELNSWQTALDAERPQEADYKYKEGDNAGKWLESSTEYESDGRTYTGGEADYRKALDAWQDEYQDTVSALLTASRNLHSAYILKPAQQAVVEKYGSVKESFMWISNIWSPDVPWRDAILDYDNFTSNISDYKEYGEVLDELDAKVDEEFNDTVFRNMMSQTTYDNVTGLLRASDSPYNVVNGYLILPILSVGLSFLSQFITARLQKKSGQAAPTGGMAGSMKMMMIIMPLMMGVFALTYTAMFTLYIVVNSATTILINVITTLAMNGSGKAKEKKLKTSDGVQKYGRPDPKDL